MYLEFIWYQLLINFVLNKFYIDFLKKKIMGVMIFWKQVITTNSHVDSYYAS